MGVTCPRQGLEMEAVVLHRVGFLAYFCPKQGQDFKPSAAPLYPNMAEKYRRPNRGTRRYKTDLIISKVWTLGKQQLISYCIAFRSTDRC